MPAPTILARLGRAILRRGDEAATSPAGSPVSVAGRTELPADSGSPPLGPVQLAIGDRRIPDKDAILDPGLVEVLGEKVLLAWLRNRYQLLFPFALDLRRLDSAQADLLVHAMIGAALADGVLDGKERERIQGVLASVGPSGDGKAVLEGALRHPKPMNDVLAEVHDVQSGALVYAAALMAVDGRKPVNRHYLRYLSARLQLSEELTASLDQRFRPSG